MASRVVCSKILTENSASNCSRRCMKRPLGATRVEFRIADTNARLPFDDETFETKD